MPALPTWWCGERNAMEEALPWLVDNLSDEGQGFYRLEQLVAEK